MAVNGKHRCSRKLDILTPLDYLGCDVTGLQETRRDRQSVSETAAYSVLYSCITESTRQRAMDELVIRVDGKVQRGHSCCGLRSNGGQQRRKGEGKTSGATYYVDIIVMQIQTKEHLLVLMDSNAFTGNRGRWGKERKATVSGRAGGASLSTMVCDCLTFAGSRYCSTGAYFFNTPPKPACRTRVG